MLLSTNFKNWYELTLKSLLRVRRGDGLLTVLFNIAGLYNAFVIKVVTWLATPIKYPQTKSKNILNMNDYECIVTLRSHIGKIETNWR